MKSFNMALAGARFRELTNHDLVREVRDERGFIAGDCTEGQVALADWMLTQPLEQVTRLVARLTDKQAVRILAGEVEPSGEIASVIAEATAGAVALAMWRRSAPTQQEPAAPGACSIAIDEVQVFEHAALATISAANFAPAAPRHVQLGDHLDLINTTAGVTIVAAGSVVTIPPSALAALHGGLAQMLGKAA